MNRLTASRIGAARLGGGRVEAVDGVVGRGAGLVAGTASLSAGSTGAALALRGLVAAGLAATDAEHLVDRHLHQLRLVGLQFGGGGLGGEGEGRHGGEGGEQHGDEKRSGTVGRVGCDVFWGGFCGGLIFREYGYGLFRKDCLVKSKTRELEVERW